MPPSTSVLSVTTEDAAPTVPAHRISRVGGFTTLTARIRFDPAASVIRAYRLNYGSPNRNGGTLVANLGAVCGLDRCGAPGVKPTAIAAPLDKDVVIDAAQVPGADGDYTVNVFAASDEGWV